MFNSTFNISSYFGGNTRRPQEEEMHLLNAMEEGKNPRGLIVSKEDPIWTVKMPSSVISDTDRARMLDQDPEARTAAGDASKFVDRFAGLLRDQYKDKEGKSRIVIGMAVYKILSKSESKDGVASIIDSKTAADVGLIVDSGGKTVIAEMDRTVTKMGNAYLQLTMTRPSADLGVVLEYQKLIKTLVEEEAVFWQLRNELEKMPEGEINLISCQDTRKQLPGSTIGLYYNIDPRVNETLNMSSLALDVSAVGTTIKKTINTAMQGISGVALPIYALSQVSSALGGPESPEFLQAFANRFTASTPIGVLGGLAIAANISVVNAAVASAAGAYSAMSVRSTYDWLIADTSMLPLMRDILSSVATYYKGMKSIHGILLEHPEIASKLKHFQKLDDFIRNTQNSNELGKLFNALESSTFNPNNKCLFRPGEVLVVWELLHSGGGKKGKGGSSADKGSLTAGDKIRAEFEGALPAIGEIDAFLSIATLIKESKNSRLKYCLPEFVQGDDQPSLQLSELWHPRIGQDQAVPNDIALGRDGVSCGIILSGPNTGGKSSFAQAAVLAMITSRMGFCAATYAKMSNFGYIRTSMDIRGSLDKAESLFAAQCKLLGEIVSGVESLPKNTHSFVALDEPCSQTNPGQGSVLAMATAEKLSQVKGNMSMIITHFRNVAEQIGDRPSSSERLPYKNYKMEGGGTFKLAEGISEESANNAFEVAERFGMGSKIVENAKERFSS
ncbi:MAG: hypothetical protein V4489_06855 [Chlamydiota bacterium]